MDSVSEDKIIVENQNIGFEILVPGSVVSELPQVGNTVKIYTYTYVREDALQLYGFLTKDSMDMFKLLITVNGIGPKAALGILTAMDTDAPVLRFFRMMQNDCESTGNRTKTASKLILELKDKCHLEDVFGGVEESFATENVSAGADAKKDAIEALVALGYSASEAAGAVRKLQVTEEMSVEDILKLSLKNL